MSESIKDKVDDSKINYAEFSMNSKSIDINDAIILLRELANRSTHKVKPAENITFEQLYENLSKQIDAGIQFVRC